MRPVVSLAALVLLAACAQAPATNDLSASEPGVMPPETQQERDWAEIEQLEDEAKAMAHAGGCASPAGCRIAPVGNRACGGPRYYLVYCAVATDSVALHRTLDEVARAETEYNQEYDISSTCELLLPPEILVTDRECRPASRRRP